MRSCSERGQSTVEAAILLPVLFVVLGLLLQPAVLLYNHCIMNAAAAEGCRLVATSTSDEASLRAYMERRLGAIPAIPMFHEGDEWDISWSGGAGEASVSIANSVQPLPLFGITAGLMGQINASGSIEQHVEASCSSVPTWTIEQGYDPSAWIGAWK